MSSTLRPRPRVPYQKKKINASPGEQEAGEESKDYGQFWVKRNGDLLSAPLSYGKEILCESWWRASFQE